MMKIGQQPDLAPVATQASQAVSSKNGQSAPASVSRGERKAAPAPSVGVTVSEGARVLEQTSTSDVADVDMAKVNAARQAIDQGTFLVNPETIADKLLANAREMLNHSIS